MNEKKLKKKLESHKHWLDEDCDGWENMRAILYGVNLCGADLEGVNLRGADLRAANLSGANLNRADLGGADLYGANLRKAHLKRANLDWANLDWTDLREANLEGANLRGASFDGANLDGANLDGACLSDADLEGAKNVPFVPLVCPDTGAFVGFIKAKFCSSDETEVQEVIVELEIAADARRSSATGRECRCDKAKVLSITTLDGVAVSAGAGTVRGIYYTEFTYKVGEIVTEPKFCEDRWKKDASGIYFFINRQEAVEFGKNWEWGV